MIQTKVVKEHGEEFLMVFMQERWWYVAKQIANFLDYSESSKALKLINETHKLTLKKKGNEKLFEITFDASPSEGDTSKTSQISFIDEDGLVVLAMNSEKPNAKLMVEKMISSFKMELDKAGLNALEALSRIEKDENILVNARISKLLNEGVIKYTHCILNKAINELVFYKYFPECQFGQDINTEKLRTTFEVDSRLKDTDITHERHIVGNELLEMLDKFYLFNEEQMGLKQAKYLYVKKHNYDEEIVKMFKDRLQK